MSVEQDIFKIEVTGSKKAITRMLNAAIHNVTAGTPIVESDDIDTINLKLKDFTGHGGRDIGIFDLLDEECMKDKEVIARKETFYNRVKACKNCPLDCPNSKRSPDIPPLSFDSEEEEYQKRDEYCPWDDPFDAEDAPVEPHRYLEVVRVEKGENDYTAKFSWYLYECYGPQEWGNWADIARLYNCRIFEDDDWYRNGQFIRFSAATIYDGSDEEIRKLHLESGSKYDAEEYPFFLKTLAHLYPDHYGVYWEQYHSEHPKVDISEDECLAWFNKQPHPWDQKENSETEEIEHGNSDYPIDENGHAVIPEGTVIIDDYAFLQCNKLVSVSIPDTVEEIGEGSFGSCANLESITLPSSLKFIDEAAFFGCKGLKSLVIPGGVKMIDARAFAECTSLTEVHLPAGVSIDSSAFDSSPSYMYFEFGTVKQMTKAVAEAISNGSLLHFSSEPDNTTQIYHTKKFKEKIVLSYRKNKIFYTLYAHNALYESWTIHEEKVLNNFIKLYEFK